MKQTHTIGARLWLFPLLAVLLLTAPGIPVFAINYGSGLYGACQYGSCSISISSNNTVSVNVTPTFAGSCTVQNDVVSVQTDNSAGYTLTVADSSTNIALQKGSDSISAISATQATPAALSANTWGYRLDGVGGFGPGPTAAQTNTSVASISTMKFAAIPASNATADTIASTSVAANPAVTTNVWYGVCDNTSVANGAYNTQVTYTAVTN